MSTYYTEDHEWVSVDGGSATIGISAYAAKALGDVVFVELPDVGTEFDRGDEAAVVESVKAASEVYAPIGGQVTEVNAATINWSAAGQVLNNGSITRIGTDRKVKVFAGGGSTNFVLDITGYWA